MVTVEPVESDSSPSKIDSWLGNNPVSQPLATRTNAAVIAILGLEAIRIASMGALGPVGVSVPLLLLFYSAVSIGALRTRSLVYATSFVVLALAGSYAVMFPGVSNHSWYTLYVLAFALVSDFSTESGRTRYTMLTRLLIAALLFYSGLHKALLPEWRSGSILTDLPHLTEGVPVRALTWLGNVAGASTAAVHTFTTNATWAAECVLGLAMLAQRTRLLAAWGCVALMALVQLSAGEYYFAALVGSGLVVSVNHRSLRLTFGAYMVFLAGFTVVDVLGRLG